MRLPNCCTLAARRAPPFAGVLFTAALLLGPSPAAQGQSFPDDDVIRARLEERIAAGPHRGIVVGLIEDGATRVIPAGESGRAGVALDGRTLFQIGSVTKVFTGILLGALVSAGDARLDEPVAALLPAGTSVPEAAGRPITLVDLATHSSGLARLPNNLAPMDMNDPYAAYTVEKLYEFLAAAPTAERTFNYSNVGAGLLGHALGVRAGIGYEAALRTRVLEPLGMRDTRVTLDAADSLRLAQGHQMNGTPASDWRMASLAAAGGLYSTAEDMLRFIAAHIAAGDGASLAAAHPAAGDNAPLDAALRTARSPHFEIDANRAVGLGWIVMRDASGSELLMHDGRTGTFAAFVAIDPARRRGVVVMTNASMPVNDIALGLIRSQE